MFPDRETSAKLKELMEINEAKKSFLKVFMNSPKFIKLKK